MSIKLMTQMMDGCLILNKLQRSRVKLCQKVMAALQCQLSKCEPFLSCFFFYCPTLTLPPKSLGLGEATRLEPLGKKSVRPHLLELYSECTTGVPLYYHLICCHYPPHCYCNCYTLNTEAGIAQLIENWTQKPCVILTWVELPGAARDFFPSVIF